MKPPRPRLPSVRDNPSAPDLAGLFPQSSSPGELQRASHAQAAFLWHYTDELRQRVETLETTSAATLEAVQRAEESAADFRRELAAKELERERREAERRSVKFWFAWLLPLAAAIAGGVGTALVLRLL